MIAVFYDTGKLEKARIAHAVAYGYRQPNGEPWPDRSTCYMNGYKESHERKAYAYEYDGRESVAQEIEALADEVREEMPNEFQEPE